MAADPSNKTLWVGEQDAWSTEETMAAMFQRFGQQVVRVKLIRDRQTNAPAGYGFVEFDSHQAAAHVLDTCNGTNIEGTSRRYRLNWSQFTSSDNKPVPQGPVFSIFVGDLAPECTDAVLENHFKMEFKDAVVGAKVVIDSATLKAKGYGFVRFNNPAASAKAISSMNGQYLLSRRMRISAASPRKMEDNSSANVRSNDPTNCTVFVGNLSTQDDTEFQTLFSGFGEIARVKIIQGNCGFVDFVHRSSAEAAVEHMHGHQTANGPLRVAWGRSGSGGGGSSNTTATTQSWTAAATVPPAQTVAAYYAAYAPSWQQAYAQAATYQQQEQYWAGGYDPYATYEATAHTHPSQPAPPPVPPPPAQATHEQQQQQWYDPDPDATAKAWEVYYAQQAQMQAQQVQGETEGQPTQQTQAETQTEGEEGVDNERERETDELGPGPVDIERRNRRFLKLMRPAFEETVVEGELLAGRRWGKDDYDQVMTVADV